MMEFTHVHYMCHAYQVYNYILFMFNPLSDSRQNGAVRTWVLGGWVAALVPGLKNFFLKIWLFFNVF